MTTFTGSGLPFANIRHALDHAAQVGTCDMAGGAGECVVKVHVPNSFLPPTGRRPVPPTVFLTYKVDGRQHIERVPLDAGWIAHRGLTYPPQRTGPVPFYASGWSLPVRSQENILRSAAYTPRHPAWQASDHWGQKPPM
jgi:hypothetical protein